MICGEHHNLTNRATVPIAFPVSEFKVLELSVAQLLGEGLAAAIGRESAPGYDGSLPPSKVRLVLQRGRPRPL